MADGRVIRSCACAPTPVAAPRPILDLIGNNEDLVAPANLYPSPSTDAHAHDFYKPHMDLDLDLNDCDHCAIRGDYNPLNFKELYGAHNHRLRMCALDAWFRHTPLERVQ